MHISIPFTFCQNVFLHIGQNCCTRFFTLQQIIFLWFLCFKLGSNMILRAKIIYVLLMRQYNTFLHQPQTTERISYHEMCLCTYILNTRWVDVL